MNARRLSLIALPLITLLASASASASKTTWIEMPGLACVGFSWNDALGRGLLNTEPSASSSPGSYNECSNCSKWLHCPVPLVRDSDLISPGPVTVGDITFTVSDRNAASGDFWCTAILSDESGGTWTSPVVYTPGGGLNAWQRFTIWDPFAGHNLDLSHFSGTAIKLECNVPAVGTIAGSYSGVMMYRTSLVYQNQ